MHTLLQMVSGLGWELSAWTALLVTAELLTLVTVPSVLLSRRGATPGRPRRSARARAR